MNKLLLPSLIALSFILSVGMTSPAFAGISPITSCIIEPDEVILYLDPNEESDPIKKTITCDGNINGFQETVDGKLNKVAFPSGLIVGNIYDIDEVVTNLGDTSEEHCSVTFNVFSFDGGGDIVVQELWINPPKDHVAG